MIKIITDSAADLPEQYIKKYDITVIPLNVEIDDCLYQDGYTISPDEFQNKMLSSKKLPKTSQPSPELFKNAFEKYVSKGYEILCLTISSKLSGTIHAATLAKNMIKNNSKIKIFDTLGASSGEGIQVIKAAEMAQNNFSIDYITNSLEKYREKINILILLDTLENIVKGGRLSKFKGTIAKILNFKLILHNNKGEVEFLERVRGKKRFHSKVLEIIDENKINISNQIVGITHVNNEEEANYFKNIIKEKYNPKEVYVNYMGSTLATYAGNKGIIISF
ncbi:MULTISPECIES: DegV family protein [unclassified Marinitoga]|uniref:DegV family protein n=1 Tax=unclassified Marinitoga TaxID=2640159 RepID=UPI0006414301|nr:MULTISPECIES: DegV family protein [unclassified Marinitoga]KLO25128.1 fatty acid-binding protein DegV [Marinitoga sp. 1155]NUU98576.1 fatty acid-binding protein DegV [Marinitoga sp. 1154]